MTDASATAVRDARLTWIVGGALLIAFAIIPLLSPSLGVILPLVSPLLDVAWAVAMVLFAFGFRGSGSVVSRKPLGIVALLVAGITPLAFDVFWLVAPRPDGPADWMLMAGTAEQLISGVALAVASVVIARAGAVPNRIRWVPLIAVGAAVAVNVLAQVVGATAPQLGQQVWLPVLLAANLIVTGALVVVGILAIVFAPREPARHPVDETVQVYPPV